MTKETVLTKAKGVGEIALGSIVEVGGMYSGALNLLGIGFNATVGGIGTVLKKSGEKLEEFGNKHQKEFTDDFNNVTVPVMVVGLGLVYQGVKDIYTNYAELKSMEV